MNFRRLPLILACVLGMSGSLCLNAAEEDSSFAKGVTIDLRDPTFTQGVLSTENGGVVTAPDLRIQAQKIIYTKKVIDGTPVYTIDAEGSLMLEMHGYIFVGDRLFYDFQTQSGTIYEGRTSSGPWFISGEQIEICPEGGFVIYNGSVTSSENINPEWKLEAETTYVALNHYIEAENLKLRIFTIPVLKLSKFHANLQSAFESPFQTYGKWGGKKGPRGGVIYEVISWEDFKLFARLDYRLNRGPGGGIETYYESPDGKRIVKTINYAAKDNSVSDLHEKTRYRFQGIYRDLLLDDKLYVDLTYDKLSDKEMASDYDELGFGIETCGRTQLEFLRHHDDWIANLLTRVRVNQFQTVKQELPTLAISWRPFELGESGIINSSSVSASYLDYTYANDFTEASDYNSPRLEFQPRFYRPFHFGFLRATPEVGASVIIYGNSPHRDTRMLFTGITSLELNTSLYKYHGSWKHLIEPYARYDYFTSPTINPNDHYIFDISDGWYRLDTVKFGCRHLIINRDWDGILFKKFGADVWTNAFIDTPATHSVFPKVYGRLNVFTTPTLFNSFQTAWNIHEGELDHFNFRTAWTVSKDLAFSVEFRHRCSFDWRKVQKMNFILDSFRPIEELRHSALSDRRDTLLIQAFCRINPSWAIAFESRNGWNRRHQPNYTEYEFDIMGHLTGGWNIKASYQHREDKLDDRVAFYVTFGFKRPGLEEQECRIPFLDF